MSVTFTTSGKKSVSAKFKEQADSTISSTAFSEDVDFNVGNPEVFEDLSISDTLTLDDIVKDANLRYVSSESVKSPNDRTRREAGASYRTHKQFSSDGEKVRFWENQGKDDGYDLIQPWEYPDGVGSPDDDIHCPVWDKDDAANPFTDGAFKFSIDQTDTNYIDELVYEEESSNIREEIRNVRSHRYFYFGDYKNSNAEELGDTKPGEIASFKNFSTGSGPYTMYAVYSVSGVGSPSNDYFSPLWTPLLGYGQDADTLNPIAQGGEVLRTYHSAFLHNPVKSANTYGFTLRDGSRSTTAGSTTSATIAHNFGIFQYTTAPDVSDGEVQIYVFTYTGTTDDKFSFFDIDSRGVVNEKKSIGSVSGEGRGTSCNVFGAPERMAYRFQIGGGDFSDYDSDHNGSSIYVAEFGYFDKALEGKTAATLCRLLREKYKVD